MKKENSVIAKDADYDYDVDLLPKGAKVDL